MTGAEWNNGYTFIANNNKTIYFQAGGYRKSDNGALGLQGSHGLYWTSEPKLEGSGKPGYAFRALSNNGEIKFPFANPNDFGSAGYGYGVRPVAE